MTQARQQPKSPSRRALIVAEYYLRRYVAKHFNGLRIALNGPPPALDGPTVFYSNHPSWWDPIVMLLLIRTQYPEWRFHGPIDKAAFERYPWLERVGLFGVEPETTAGARRFLEAGAGLLESDRTGLAMTAQGRFMDARQRPLGLKRGLSVLLRQNPSARAFPIAIEYVHWNERLPEILVRCGGVPIAAKGRPAEPIHAELEGALEQELDALSTASLARDPAAFRCLVEGRRGVGFLQDLPLRLRALASGRRFDPSHSAVGRDPG